MEVGSYAHRAILHEPEDIPSIEQARLSPTEMPFTSDDFDPQLEQAYELMPELLGAEGAEMRYAINGLLSLTCDGNPILGESEVAGLWTAAAVWIKEGPGRRAGDGRVDDARPLRDRRPPQRRRPLPRPPEAPRAHPAADHRVVHQDLRHHPPGRAVHVRPRPAALADARLAAEARGGVLRDRRLGAALLVRVQRRPPRGVRRRRDAARARVGLAVVEPDHQRRAPADAGGGRGHRPVGVLHLRHHRAGCPRHRPGHLRRPVRRGGRQGRLHAGAGRQGRLPLRPDRDATGGGPLPGRHRRRPRDGRPRVVRRPPAGGRWHHAHRPDRRRLHDRHLGSPGARHPLLADRRRRLGRRLRLPPCREIDVRRHHGAGLAHLLRRRARLGALRPDGVGRRPVGGAARGRRTARRRARRHRRLRHHRPDREGLSRVRRRARQRAHDRRGGHAAPQGEAGRLRRQGGLPRPAGGRPGRPSCAPSPSTTTPRRAA